uniref:Membrane protein n=1 Tax=Escherichia phage fEgEco12 TaxID=3158837 RepID=A0AAU7PGZ6_9CAUD
MRKNIMKNIFITLTIFVSITLCGCAPKVQEADAEFIRQNLTKLNYDGTLYACHEMRHGQDLNLMCRKIVNRTRLNTIPKDAQ